MNFALMDYKMKIKKISKKDIQAKLGLSDSAMYRKLKGITEFTREEIQTIIEALNLSDEEVMDIFFSD